ncbi:uncharacterized protein LOC131948459 [Physella acuta]|uniref:uncharacterized protein LOC131948459 n=1 Tax=Physella acuta TaxID=109671 RepID=UPI0027DACB61|nr:uncharacterized protein LOC131948459 [Physella acuta]
MMNLLLYTALTSCLVAATLGIVDPCYPGVCQATDTLTEPSLAFRKLLCCVFFGKLGMATPPPPTQMMKAQPALMGVTTQKPTTTTDICDFLCDIQLGGEACLCSHPSLPG